jgi:uncharacterized protein DUF4255
MSNHLAIATVTAALRELLLPAVQTAVAGADVTLARPHAAATGATAAEAANVNLYLYQVSPNAALRNLDLPTRAPDGRLMQRPQTGFDLHYLLTFYGSQRDLEPERLLGNVVKTLHARPLLERSLIEQLVTHTPSPYPGLARSDLHRAVDLVKFRPLLLSLEELSKLWSVFLQTPYTLSAAYVGSAVLIESESAPASALPVRSRQIHVDTFRQPFIERVSAGDDPLALLHADSLLRIAGRQLKGELTRLRLGSRQFTPTSASDARVELDLATVPAGQLRAGVQGVQVQHYRAFDGGPPRITGESNVASIVLHPRLDAVTLDEVTPQDGLRDLDIGLGITPAVAAGQKLVLMLSGAIPAAASYAFSLDSPAADTGHIDSTIRGVAPGEYLVRIQVDGAPSQLGTDAGGAYNAPKVTIT